MDIKQGLQNAARNLLVNKMRFIQSIMSLVVAVAAVIVICNTCRLMVQQLEASWTPEILSNIDMYINTRVDFNKRPTIEDLEKIAKNNPDIISTVSPYVLDNSMGGNVRYGDKYCKEASFVGVNENYLDMMLIKLESGRFIQYMDCNREHNVCVVSGDIANKIMNGNAVGKTLNIWGINFEVIGVMEDNSPRNAFDGLIYMPYTCAKKLIGEQIRTGYQNDKYYVNRFLIKANGIENIKGTSELIKNEMIKVLGTNEAAWRLNFASFGSVKEDVKGYIIASAFKYMLFAFVVLIVGGVGIMNVMLASVQERTREIGLRKAFGATNKDIQRQFSLEAVITSLIGGLIGVLFGIMLSFSIPWLISDMTIGDQGISYSASYLDISLSIWPILLALAVSVGVGVIFGTYPAQQAAKMEIVDALRD